MGDESLAVLLTSPPSSTTTSARFARSPIRDRFRSAKSSGWPGDHWGPPRLAQADPLSLGAALDKPADHERELRLC